MTHDNYFEIEAATPWELGLRKGELFGHALRKTLKRERKRRSWAKHVAQAEAYLKPTARHFPNAIEEFRGYSKGADVAFEELWTLDLLEELSESYEEKCTTIVSNSGMLLGHNEDWEPDAEDEVCILRRTVGDQTTFELFYLNTLGGNAIGLNSWGVAHAVNTLDHRDHQIGVPKNVVARWLSDTSSPEEAYQTLIEVKRASGYHHTLVNRFGWVWSIECSAKKQVLTKPELPFVHTNHYLVPQLTSLEGNEDQFGTLERHTCASGKIEVRTSVEELRKILTDRSAGKRQSIFSRRTIAAMILDIDHMAALVWLRREDEKGWIAYETGF